MKWESVAPCLLVGSIVAMGAVQSDDARAQSSPTLLAATGTAGTDSRGRAPIHGLTAVRWKKSSSPPVSAPKIFSAHRSRSPRSPSRIWKTMGSFP